ncbi:MAG: hypothetical protein LUG55_11010 [Clostridiales bacterium]|nr:hypothetical protein [Clostridiales bacterium]
MSKSELRGNLRQKKAQKRSNPDGFQDFYNAFMAEIYRKAPQLHLFRGSLTKKERFPAPFSVSENSE